MEADVTRGEYIDPKAGREYVGSFGSRWLALQRLSTASRKKYESVLRLHVEPHFRKRRVKTVKPSEIDEWLVELESKYGYATVSAAYRVICGIFDLAVADELRRDNPARAKVVHRPGGGPAERSPWTAEQAWRIIQEHPEEYRLLPALAVGCGLRQGEIHGLSIDDIDFDGKVIHVRRQLLVARGRAYFKLPKYGKTRTVPLPDWVAHQIRLHVGRAKPRPYSLPWEEEDGKVAKELFTCNLLLRWSGPANETLRGPSRKDPRTYDKHVAPTIYNDGVWKPALSRVGLIPPPVLDEENRVRYLTDSRLTGIHMLRHLYTTILMDAGVSLIGIIVILGHSRKGAMARIAPTTLGTYGHVTDETYEAARQAVGKTVFRLRAVPDGTVTEQRAAQ
ncbi:tyrosine-type recombinase/integrase [Actinoallomurus sp. NPDC052274]|uniref:tyrosine-type recombinase/integrase n=1 Tax=Actinoallomurus sp. NPDC052274 TaxID=3155420 RepID=UPI0034174777